MWSNISLGRYYPVKSFIHSLNSASKILCILLFIFSLMIFNNILMLLGLTVLTALVMHLSNVPIKLYLKAIGSLKILLIFLFIFNLFIFKLSLISVIIMLLRIVLIVIYTSVLTFTTSPNEITYGLEEVFKPLKYLKVPVNEMALTLSLALKFIPNVMSEAAKILKSQSSRGIDFKNSNIFGKIKALSSMLIPMFILSFKRADQLSDAMEVKLYNYSDSRTNYKMNKWGLKDNLATILHFLILTLFIVSEVIWL